MTSQRLIAVHGADARLTDLLQTLANCKKAHSVSIHDRCKAVFEGLIVECYPANLRHQGLARSVASASSRSASAANAAIAFFGCR